MNIELAENTIFHLVADLGAALREYHAKIEELNAIIERLTSEKEKCIKSASQ